MARPPKNLALRVNELCNLYNYEDWLATQKEKKNRIWLYKEENTILGYINIIIDVQNKSGDISSVGVLPNHRKKGIGAKLLTFAQQYLYNHDVNLCYLTAAAKNKRAISLYKNLGFVTTDHYIVFRLQQF
ncbi:MAG: GNAT family N-acetyltransferase [Candidatus Berkiella sp.]